jgi:hypothetical protein
MKRTITFFIACLMAIISNNALGQGDGAGGGGLISIEVTASPFVDTDALLYPGFIRGKYNLGAYAVRLGFIGSLDNDETNANTILHSGFFDIRPGGEYYLATGKATIYAGGEFIIQNRSSNKNSTTEIGVKNALDQFGRNQAYFGYGVGIFAGLDYYWGKSFYVGMEVGYELVNRSYKGVEMAGVEIIEPTKNFLMGTNFSNMFKLGFNF